VQEQPSGRRPRLALIAPIAVAAVVALVALGLVLRPDSEPEASPSPTSTLPPSTPMLTGFPRFAGTVKGSGIDVHNEPDPDSKRVVHLGPKSENGAPQTFLIERESGGSDGRHWFFVLLPIRPNGSKGWVRASEVKTTGLRYQLLIHLKSFNLDLIQDGRRVLAIKIGVGADNTPTPEGEYYIKELIRPPNQNTVYGHYVFGLNGFSNVLVNWPGGGVLGIHGTNDEAGLGKRVSHGCIRMTNHNIELLSKLLPLGTPVKVQND
jgi:hypothetical protein